MGSLPVLTCESIVVCGNTKSMSTICSSVGFSRALTSSCRKVVCPRVINLRVGIWSVLKSWRMSCLRVVNYGGGRNLSSGLTKGVVFFTGCKYLCLS